MTVHVDAIQTYDTHLRYKNWSHMMTDNSDAFCIELHKMALAIGLEKRWFQHKNPRFPHYDITPSKRILAIKLGAIEIDTREMIRLCTRKLK